MATSPAPDTPPAPQLAGRNPSGFPAWAVVATVVLAGQLAWLIAQSVSIYRRFALTSDFALFYQAAHQIAGGTLSPAGTIYRAHPFLTNHFELFIYPLSLLVLVDRGGLLLLLAQDLATVAAEAVAFLWITNIVRQRWQGGDRGRHLLVAGSLAVLALDPWIWWANAFDVHLQAFATLFAVLAARAFWHQRRTAWLWVAAVLSCGTVEAAVLIGLGLFLVCSSAGRRRGVGLLAATAAWIIAWNASGFDLGSQLGANYRYLTGSGDASVGAVALGALRHPVTVVSHLFHRKRDLWHFLGGSGFLGLASPLGLAMVLAVFIPGALNLSPYVVAPQSSFQLLPLLLFVPVGSVLVVCWLVARPSSWGKRLAALAGAAAVLQVAVLSVIWIPRASTEFLQVTPAGARVLSSVLAQTPADAEVVSSNGFVGRFAGHRWVYTDFGPASGAKVRDEPVPVHARVLELVLSARQGIYQGPPPVTAAAIAELEHRRGVRLVAHGAGIYAFVWRAPPGARTFNLYGFRGTD